MNSMTNAIGQLLSKDLSTRRKLTKKSSRESNKILYMDSVFVMFLLYFYESVLEKLMLCSSINMGSCEVGMSGWEKSMLNTGTPF